MLVDLKKAVAYICPFCSNISSRMLSVFNFSGTERIQLICPTHGCHEVCVNIIMKNNRYKLDIECPLCGEMHSYSIAKDSFWHKDILTYKCPVAGIDIFFAGDENEVEKKLNESTDVYSDIDYFEEDYEDESFSLLYAIIDRLHKLKDKHHISCICGHDDIDFNIVNGNIILTCTACGKSKVIDTNEDTLTRLLNSHAVIIGN
ncbi:MAG: hypothetical protein J1F01_05090 [Oscillospiraceae bacterium]|nr:hypothetical protein [Oscillospiraceae bacterium]